MTMKDSGDGSKFLSEVGNESPKPFSNTRGKAVDFDKEGQKDLSAADEEAVKKYAPLSTNGWRE